MVLLWVVGVVLRVVGVVLRVVGALLLGPIDYCQQGCGGTAGWCAIDGGDGRVVVGVASEQ